MQLDYYASLKSFQATNEFRRGEANYLDNVSFGPNTFSIAARYGQIINGAPSQNNPFTLGGFLQLSAYRPGELAGTSVVFSRLSYNRRLENFRNPFGRNLYAGLSAEFGRVAASPELLWKTDTKNSVAAYLGIDTLIGPLYIGYARARERSSIFYLFLGQP